jgi:hypothetical protein
LGPIGRNSIQTTKYREIRKQVHDSKNKHKKGSNNSEIRLEKQSKHNRNSQNDRIE